MNRPSRSQHWLVRLRQRLNPSAARRTVRQQRGQAGERLACAYLRQRGYEILATNVRFRIGELDIVARDGETLCFVEVRSSTTAKRFGPVAASITLQKRRHLVRAAEWYLNRQRVPCTSDTRFDVVAIDWRGNHQPTIELIKGAFTADA